jgi:hypothetical protein
VPFDRGADEAQVRAIEVAGVVAVRPVHPRAKQARPGLLRLLGHRDVLGLAGGAARQREHERRFGGEHLALAAHDARDVGAKALEVAHRHAPPKIGRRADVGEAVLPAERGVAVRAHHREQKLELRSRRIARRA